MAHKKNPNRKYKDSVFVSLFSDTALARLLYNAVSGHAYGADTPVAIKTLSDVFYRNLKNDLAFLLGDRLIIFFEHQSSENENIALRMLFYVAAVYQELIDKKALYRERRIPLPRPEFYMLYIGPDEKPDIWHEDLSDSFKRILGHEELCLELRVTVININCGHNAAILDACEALRGYAVFVDKVREFFGDAKGLSDEARQDRLSCAIEQTIRYCLEHDILAEFLKRHSGEVVTMFAMEFDIDVAREVWREEAREEGLQKGMEEGLSMGREEGLQKGAQKKQQEILDLMKQARSLEDSKQPASRPRKQCLVSVIMDGLFVCTAVCGNP